MINSWCVRFLQWRWPSTIFAIVSFGGFSAVAVRRLNLSEDAQHVARNARGGFVCVTDCVSVGSSETGWMQLPRRCVAVAHTVRLPARLQERERNSNPLGYAEVSAAFFCCLRGCVLKQPHAASCRCIPQRRAHSYNAPPNTLLQPPERCRVSYSLYARWGVSTLVSRFVDDDSLVGRVALLLTPPRSAASPTVGF